MKRSEHQDAWTRLLDGEPVSRSELAALDAESQAKLAWLFRDAEMNGLLQAAYLSDDTGPQTASTEQFAEQVKARIRESAVPVAPPIETPATAWSPNVTPHDDPAFTIKPSAAILSARPGSVTRMVMFASAASILFVVVSAMVWFAGPRGERQVGERSPITRNAAQNPDLVVSDHRPVDLENSTVSGGHAATEGVIAGQPDSDPSLAAETEPRSGSPDNLASKEKVERGARPSSAALPIKMADIPQLAEPIGQTDSASTLPDSQSVAALTTREGAIWQDGYDPPAELRAEKLSLVSGVARLRLGKGAEVTLDGPVELKLVDDNRITLQSGHLEAFVPKSASGFEVQTPGARVIDLGTRFHVRTNREDELTYLEVLEGTVEVIHSSGRRTDRDRKYKMSAGQTKWLSYDGTLALDWRMVLQFGDPAVNRNRLVIDGRALDVSLPNDAAIAMREVFEKFSRAGVVMDQLPRGQRFAGQLVVDGTTHKLASERELTAARLQVMQRIQERWTSGMFDQVFPQGMPAEMKEFFNSNGFAFPRGPK